MFHTHDGWFFERRSDGSVRVIKFDGPGFPEPSEVVKDSPEHAKAVVGFLSSYNNQQPKVLDVILDANTWASVVASMSKQGETAETFREACLFHTGKPFDIR